MRKGLLASALVAVSVLPGGGARADAEVDAKIAAYQKVGGVAGNLSAIGSDTLNNVMTMWAESFRKVYPSVQVQVEGKGSSTAPPALIAGTAQLGPMSREMKADELDAFEKKFGYPPTQIRVAIDASTCTSPARVTPAGSSAAKSSAPASLPPCIAFLAWQLPAARIVCGSGARTSRS